MRSYLVTLVYRLPAVAGRREASALERGLGHAHVSSCWTDDTLEVEVWAQAPSPSDAVALSHRRVTNVWPNAGTTRDPAPSMADDLQEPASTGDGHQASDGQDPTRGTPSRATDMPELHSVSWQHSGHDGPAGLAGVHEPRRPAPSSGHLAAALTVPHDPITY
jgi:hypothetical protein